MKTLNHRPPFIANATLRLWMGVVVATLVAGCQHVNYLRDAQDSFTAAAQIETKTRLAGDNAELERQLREAPAAALADLASVQSGYASAIQSLRMADASKLRQDKLLGVALTLQALSEWRLGQHTEALATKARAEKEAADQIYPRDAAVLAALPGLIKTDLAYARILTLGTNATENKSVFKTEIEPRLVGEKGAIQDLQAASAKVEPGHPIQLYLIQCQLAAYRDYQLAHQRVLSESPSLTNSPHMTARTNLTALKALTERLEVPTTGQNLVSFWERYNIRPFSP
jgi:hypothetical protein